MAKQSRTDVEMQIVAGHFSTSFVHLSETPMMGHMAESIIHMELVQIGI